MEEAKQLVVIVDRTASMAPYWNSIAKFYLAPIVKQLCRANKIASGYLSNTLHSVITYGFVWVLHILFETSLKGW